MSDRRQSDRVLVAIIGAAHGIKGEVRVRAFTDDPGAIADYGPLETKDGARQFTIAAMRPHKAMVVVKFAGINDRTAAEGLNGTELFVARARLPGVEDDDEFYHADLIGLEAVSEDGDVLGTIIAVPNYGAGDLLEIAPGRGKSLLFPFTRDVVPVIDIAGGRVTIVPPIEVEGREP